MVHSDFELLRRNPDWLTTLQAYWDTHLQLKNELAEYDGWVGRIASIPEIPADSLSSIHGKLIAFGYLKFDLSPKDTALRYQLTPLGRTAVTGETTPDADHFSSDHEPEH
jgi:hypothetical protein